MTKTSVQDSPGQIEMKRKAQMNSSFKLPPIVIKSKITPNTDIRENFIGFKQQSRFSRVKTPSERENEQNSNNSSQLEMLHPFSQEKNFLVNQSVNKTSRSDLNFIKEEIPEKKKSFNEVRDKSRIQSQKIKDWLVTPIDEEEIKECNKRIGELHPLRNYPILSLFPSLKKFLNFLKRFFDESSKKMEKPVLNNYKAGKEDNIKKISQFMKMSIANQHRDSAKKHDDIKKL